jgi:hypothetical protein
MEMYLIIIIRIRKSKDRQCYDQNKKDNQRSTKHTHKTKDRVTRTPLKTGGELRCSTSRTRRVNRNIHFHMNKVPNRV